MTLLRRLAARVLVVALLAVAGYGAVWAFQPGGVLAGSSPSAGGSAGGGAKAAAGGKAREARASEGTVDQVADEPTTESTAEPSTEPATEPAEPAAPVAGPTLLGEGDEGSEVRDLQARLRQIQWFAHDVTGIFGPITAEAVSGFQAKRGIAVTGAVDRTTLDRLEAMTHEPTTAELANQPTGTAPGPLDARCTTGRALCIDKTSRTLRWVVDGTVRRTLDVRFGAEYSPTREGLFSVGWKSRDHVSSIYGSSMPYAMFFSGGQAVHYSSDFAAVGYAGASHGCVNVRDLEGIQWLFDHVREGDKVVVYWS